MKRITAAILAMIMSVTLAFGAFAETAETGSEVPSEQVNETLEMEEEDENAFLTWLREGANLISEHAAEGWDMASEAVKAGWEEASQAVTSGMEWLQEKSTEWLAEAEAYMKEHEWDRKVQDAWETLKKGAAKTGEIAADKLAEAYQTVHGWVWENSEEVNEDIAEAVDSLGEAAGVAQASVSSWCRTMEEFMEEKQDLVTEEVKEAMDVIREYARDAESVTAEKLEEASQTVQTWLESVSEESDAENVPMEESKTE